MSPDQKPFQTLFRLRPLKEAKVSEISENTAVSPVPPEDRVNFHIGHPIQDKRLDQAYQSLMFRSEFTSTENSKNVTRRLIEDGLWEKNRANEIELLRRAAIKTVAYMPRGGYQPGSPGKEVELIFEHLLQTQKEPLEYDTGRETGRKEITFISGGIDESLRVFLHSLAHNLVLLPANIHMWHAELPGEPEDYPRMAFTFWDFPEEQVCQALEDKLRQNQNIPTCFILGRTISEAMRRKLRFIGLQQPVLFVEVNDAPHHLSLAREAGLKNSVLRMMTPAVVDPALASIPVVFAAGDTALCEQLKGMFGKIETVSVKTAIGASAVNLHPKAAWMKIRKGVEKSLREVSQYKPYKLSSPYTLVLTLKREEMVYNGAFYPGAERTGEWELTYKSDSILDIAKAFIWMRK